MSVLPLAVHQTIVCVDVEGFGDRARTTPHRLAVREGLYRALRRAFERSGVSWLICRNEDRGDGVMVLVPPDVPKSVLVTGMPRELAAALAEYNLAQPPPARMRLRLAIHAGEVCRDDHGVVGTAVNLAHRLLEASALKRALVGSPGVLAMIASEWMYDEVIRQTPASAPACYRRVRVSVKETETTAWICLPDASYLPERRSESVTAEPTITVVREPLPAAAVAAASRDVASRDVARPADLSHTAVMQAGPAVPRVLLGGWLRQLREACGITRQDAGVAISASLSKISRLEAGRSGVGPRDLAELLTMYGVHDERERVRLLGLAARANVPGWLRTYGDVLPRWAETRLELEQAASFIRSYRIEFIPGLLQIPPYARAVLQLYRPWATSSEMDRLLHILMQCQQILHRPAPAKLWVVMDEMALHRRPDGSAATLRQQLENLIEMAELPNVAIQVTPVSTGVAAAGPITLLRFAEPELDDVVYLDNLSRSTRLDKPDDVAHYCEIMNLAGIRAQSPKATTAILHSILKRI